jgi:hypothetical protein
MAGVIAGKMTKTNTLGFVGSFPIPEVLRNINAFTLGAQSVNPKIKTKVVWVSTWFDPPKESEAAQSLINQGADVLLQNTDSTAVLQTAEKKHLRSQGPPGLGHCQLGPVLHQGHRGAQGRHLEDRAHRLGCQGGPERSHQDQRCGARRVQEEGRDHQGWPEGRLI